MATAAIRQQLSQTTLKRVPSGQRSSGRPRSEPTRVTILATTMKLLEKSSLQDLSIEAIAKESKTSKATIYRWWKSKVSIVIDAFIEHHVIHTPISRNVPVKEALTKHIASLVKQYSGQPGKIVAQILAAGQSDAEVLRDFRERFHYGRRAAVRELLEEGKRNGEFRKTFDTEFVMDVLYAPIYMRLILAHLPLDGAFAARLPKTVFPLIDAEDT